MSKNDWRKRAPRRRTGLKLKRRKRQPRRRRFRVPDCRRPRCGRANRATRTGAGPRTFPRHAAEGAPRRGVSPSSLMPWPGVCRLGLILGCLFPAGCGDPGDHPPRHRLSNGGYYQSSDTRYGGNERTSDTSRTEYTDNQPAPVRPTEPLPERRLPDDSVLPQEPGISGPAARPELRVR